MSFQGRLQSPSGAIVPDGYYNIQFKLYQDGDGTAAGNTEGSPAGSLKWTENHVNNNANQGIRVKNGYFSVTLGSVTPFGSSVDWNQDTLWLSMNIAGTAANCTDFTSCSPDGEMLPMKRLTAVPYAIQAQNATTVGGMNASELIHNQNTAQQTASNFWISGTGRADTALQAPAIDTATATTLTIGAANATGITLAQDVTVAAGQTLTMAGGNTASRPASPTEGMLYYDTATKQLLVYANGKWQSDGKTATKIVAASNSPQSAKDGADFVADGEASVGVGTIDGDQVQINQAIAALPASGGSIYLAEGTYYIDDSIVLPSNVKLSGAGDASIITINNSFGTGRQFVVNSDTVNGNSGIIVEHLKFDGNRANNGGNGMTAIRFTSVGSGVGSSAVTGAVITNTKFVNLSARAIDLPSSSNTTVSNNVFIWTASAAVWAGPGVNIRVVNNSFSSAVQAVEFDDVDYSMIADNNIDGSNNANGSISLQGGSSDNTVSNNLFKNNGNISLRIASSRNNIIASNLFTDNGGSGAIDVISISGSSDNNTISRNTFRDTVGTGRAIYIGSSSADNNYLDGNSLSGPGASTIQDGGTGTIYGGQTDNSGNYIIQPAGTVELMKNTNVTGALSASTAVLAPSIDRADSGTLTIGSTSATAITVGRTSANTQTTFLGTALFKPTTGNDSTAAFQLQRANGTAMFTADSTNQTITIGNAASGNYIVISTSTGQLTKYGTSRNTQKITLTAEYAGSVLDAGSGGSNNSGTMTSSVDLTNRMNYYNWTTAQTSGQSYDVVVQVPIPADFDGWAGSNPLSISTYSDDVSNSTITLEARDSGGAVRCNFVSVTPGSDDTWATNNSACTLSTGTYTAGDYLTLRIRMESQDDANVRIGNINLSYLSNK